MGKLESYRETFTDADFKPLKELLPLELPLSMIIDPANICNFRCRFCPTGDEGLLKGVGRPKGTMDFRLFCKIVDDIAGMVKGSGRKLKRIHLMKDGEPFLNKRLTDMVSYIRDKDISEYIATSTNGSLLSRKISSELIKSGLDVIRISIEHVNDRGYRELASSSIGYEQIRKNVAFLYAEKERLMSGLKIFVKIIDAGLTVAEKDKFMLDFGEISDFLNIEKLHGWSKLGGKDFSLGISSDVGWDGRSKLVARKVCPEPFTKLAVNFNGEVSVCCADWSMGTIVGDLRRQNIMQIWNGEKLRSFRKLHLKEGRDRINACASCEFIKGFPEYTMLDDDAQRLIKLYSPQAPHVARRQAGRGSG